MPTYYTDGSCWPNPGFHGSYALIKNHKKYMVGTESGETSNVRMEGLGIIAAMEDAEGDPCIIYTDSQLWVNTIVKWAPGWEALGWRRRGDLPIANLDLVQYAYDLYQRNRVMLNWVRGHNGDPGNEKADKLADLARKAFTEDDLTLLPDEVIVGYYNKEEAA